MNTSDISLNRRLIDLTYGDLIQIIKLAIEATRPTKPESVPAMEEGKVHPETGLPEASDDEVGSQRAREILRSRNEPLGKAPLVKYRTKPNYDITGRNIGGFGLPYKIIGNRTSYKVKDLLAIRKDLKHFLK